MRGGDEILAGQNGEVQRPRDPLLCLTFFWRDGSL